jgi:hypothetical protein
MKTQELLICAVLLMAPLAALNAAEEPKLVAAASPSPSEQ